MQTKGEIATKSTNFYAANIVLQVVFVDGVQNEFTVWENVVVIVAFSSDQAFDEAKKIGTEMDGDEFFWNDRPAVWKYRGVRKLLEIDSRPESSNISHGTEITFSQFSMKSDEDLTKFVQGETVEIACEE